MLEKTSVGSATSLMAITVVVVAGLLFWKRRANTQELDDTYVEYKEENNEIKFERNEIEREETRQETDELNKLKDEIDVIKTINNIVTLTGEGMNEMVKSLENMAASMECMEAPKEQAKGSTLLPDQIIRPFRGELAESEHGGDFEPIERKK